MLIISGCDKNKSIFENPANLNWQKKQTDKYCKKAIEIDSNKIVVLSHYSIFLSIISEFDVLNKQIKSVLKSHTNSIKHEKTGSSPHIGQNIAKESHQEIIFLKKINRSSSSLSETYIPAISDNLRYPFNIEVHAEVSGNK